MSICPGCGLRAPDRGLEADPRYNASGECYALYSELSAYSLSRGYERFIHQHVADAYGLQHGVDRPSNIGVAFTLIGLYLALERGFSGRDVQRAHMRLARLRKRWPACERPSEFARMNVDDVMRAAPGDDRDDAILHWAAAVWETWRSSHAQTRELCRELLDVALPIEQLP